SKCPSSVACILIICPANAGKQTHTHTPFPQALTKQNTSRFRQKTIKLSCPGGQIRDQNDKRNDSLELLYKDENTGKYDCMKDDSALSHIFVKFRTCDNCVEFDMTSIVSILVGNLVATTGIGVAVYLVASQTRTSRGPSKKKRNTCSHTHLTPDVYDKIRNK
uniref:Uncharacterized protein n=1 Tax=Oryzias latipes TaxID=8090 RepID=A0A3P9LUD7_ORYLA